MSRRPAFPSTSENEDGRRVTEHVPPSTNMAGYRFYRELGS